MRGLVGIREPAAYLVDVVVLVLIQEAERDYLVIALLLGHGIVVQSIPAHAGRRARLEAADRYAELL